MGTKRGSEQFVRGFIAIVEDDEVLRRNLVRGLAGEGFEVIWHAFDGRSALGQFASVVAKPDALILDLGLPDADGLDVLAALRSHGLSSPAIALTARTTLTDRLQSFGAGVDDHLAKPFELAELGARLDVLIRRSSPDRENTPLRLDPLTHGIEIDELSVPLSPTEYRLLSTLLVRRGEVVRRATLVASAWPTGAIVHDNTLDVYIAKLRRALKGASATQSLETVRGVGYRLS
jgi:DNA-binding response OmpR family regulator